MTVCSDVRHEKGGHSNVINAPSSLLTDRYELSMLEGALASGVIDAPATFEVFTRSLANGYRYGVLGGTGRLIDELASFRFDEPTISWLLTNSIVGPTLASYLAEYRFQGDVFGYLEGEVFTAQSPVLRIEGRFADIVLETLTLSILNYDSGIATKASRVVHAAAGRGLIEMGSRRTNEVAAVAAARAAYVAGFAATSNLAAGLLYGVPTAGTVSHAFILAHPSERVAFQAQVAVQGSATTLLVDTFDTEAGTLLALEVAGPGLGAIRIDSGDMVNASQRSRKLLDEQGATNVKITLTGDLDEFAIAELLAREAAVDTFGVGTKLVSGYAPPGFVFKLVAIKDADVMRPVAKRSIGKLSTGGAKDAYRLTTGGFPTEFIVARNVDYEAPPGVRTLSHHLFGSGGPVISTAVDVAKAHAALAISELPVEAFDLRDHSPVLTTAMMSDESE